MENKKLFIDLSTKNLLHLYLNFLEGANACDTAGQFQQCACKHVFEDSPFLQLQTTTDVNVEETTEVPEKGVQ